VLTTDQLAALKFSNLTTARHRLSVLVRLGVLRRFRPHRETGSTPWHYVLGPVGAAMLGQEDRDEKKWAPQVRADRQLALERSQRLGHITGASWFFVALARHAREHGGELAEWLNEAETVLSSNRAAAWADIRSRFPHPDGAGTWAEDGHQVRFLLEYDTGSENLPALAGKLDGYQALASALAWNDQVCPVALFCFASLRREQSARRALAATREAPALRIATATIDPRTTSPARPAWLPLITSTGSQVLLIDLDDALPDPWFAYRQEQARKRHEIAERDRMYCMTAATTPRTCAYPGCEQPTATPGSDRGAKPKYCDDPDHNPLSAHRERRRREAEAKGQRAEETGGQPVTLGITRAAELVAALEKLTKQHADTLTRAITELREVGDIESAEAEVYAARTGADQRVAIAEARLAEEIQRRRDAESERAAAQADREQADDAAAQATARMEQLERELAELRAATETEVRQVSERAATEIRQARESVDRDISAVRAESVRQVADAEDRAGQAEQDAARARQAEAAAVTRAEHAQAAAAEETARLRADHQHALDQLTTATTARVSALEETRDSLRVRAERAETDLDAARVENRRLAEQLAQAASAETGGQETDGPPAPRPRSTSRTKKTPTTRPPKSEA
jgi:hypothetical protein